MAKPNLFYAQSGGVTSVINASACGVIETARLHKDKIGLSIQAAAGTRRIWTLNGPVKDVSSASFAAGLRLGGKPGRIGGAAAIVTVAGLLVWVLSTWQD